MEILKGVIKKGALIIIPSALISAFFEWKKLPLGIITGGLLGILNLRGLTKSVEGFMGSGGSTAKAIFMSMTRLFILFTAIFILVWFKIINILGLVFGFTVILVLILIEGAKVSKSS